MKTTVLKASIKLAEALSKDLLDRQSKKLPGYYLFTRTETKDGFEIHSSFNKQLVLKWVDHGPGLRSISYEENLITI